MRNSERGAEYLDAIIAKQPKLTSPLDCLDEITRLWKEGMPKGDLTGWPTLDDYYTVLPGQMTIVTGWPGHGKSEFIDALLLNLSRQNWKFAVFSFENQPVSFHVTKMLEKLSGLPFGDGRSQRIAGDAVSTHLKQLNDHFTFCEASVDNFSLDDVLKSAERFLKQTVGSKRGIVIDPYNELEHSRDHQDSETEHISRMLSTIRNWARINQTHVWLIAHPAKARREEGKLPIPRPDMISGSQHWWNKADCALTVWRDAEKPERAEVDIHIQKVRFKHIGRPGIVTLRWERLTGRYIDDVGQF